MTDKSIFTVNDMTCGHCAGTVRKALEEALPEEKFPGFRKEYAEPARFFELFPGWGFVVLRLSDDAVAADLYSGNGRTPEKTVVLSEPMPEKLVTEPETPKKR